ncbi:hypothetical protein PIROE2DRAFT_12764 [Piromyces sp. E2]|nr:hypothetical protein PIROE2DRAFT_12764 [Piromyces sp. E2]|eukprot:OUM61270.1 hypothetical protein PIROE2DRAFT_12764 [Piromyces sp. E2]
MYAERKYLTFDRELLALSETLFHYRILIRQGQRLYTATDHKNLVIYINSGSKVETNRKLKNQETPANISARIFKETVETLLESNKKEQLKEFVFTTYDQLNLNLETINKNRSETTKLLEEMGKIYKRLDKIDQRINDVRYDLKSETNRLAITKLVNEHTRKINSLVRLHKKNKNNPPTININ